MVVASLSGETLLFSSPCDTCDTAPLELSISQTDFLPSSSPTNIDDFPPDTLFLCFPAVAFSGVGGTGCCPVGDMPPLPGKDTSVPSLLPGESFSSFTGVLLATAVEEAVEEVGGVVDDACT